MDAAHHRHLQPFAAHVAMPPRSPLALTARFPELSSSDGEAMSEADDGGAGLLGRTPSFADNDRLKGALKPFVMRADFIEKYSQKHLEVKKIMDHKEMLQGMKKLDNRMSFNLKDLQKCLFDIYEERTAAGEDIGLLSTDVTVKDNWQAAVEKTPKGDVRPHQQGPEREPTAEVGYVAF